LNKEIKSPKKSFDEERKKIFEKLKAEFLSRQNRAGHKGNIFTKQRSEHRDRVNNVYNLTSPFTYPVFQEIREIQDEDKDITFDDALQLVLPKISNEDLITAVKKLSILKAYEDFSYFIDDYYKENFAEAEVLESEIGKHFSNIRWIGTNQTEFVQFVYALYEAKLITNDEDKITYLVRQLAEIFQVDLGKNWQSSLTKSITERNYDYEPKIFIKLQEGFKSYVKRRLNTEEKKGKNKKS